MERLILGLVSGVAFGFVIQRAGATDPDKMGRAHLMLNPDIPRFMLAAVALSIIGLAGLQAVDVGRTVILPTSIVATGSAAILFGIGWGLCGYCPGTTWAAAGEGRLDALFALVGGIGGAALFAHLHELLIPLVYAPTNMGPLTFSDVTGSSLLGMGAVLVLLIMAIFLVGRFWRA